MMAVDWHCSANSVYSTIHVLDSTQNAQDMCSVELCYTQIVNVLIDTMCCVYVWLQDSLCVHKQLWLYNVVSQFVGMQDIIIIMTIAIVCVLVVQQFYYHFLQTGNLTFQM